jgi:hypothetical protein
LTLEGLSRTRGWIPLASVDVGRVSDLRVGFPHPNPFRARTILSWEGTEGPVRIQIFDVQGRLVLTAVPEEPLGTFSWMGRDGAGRQVAPGLYFLRLQHGRTAVVRRVFKTG